MENISAIAQPSTNILTDALSQGNSAQSNNQAKTGTNQKILNAKSVESLAKEYLPGGLETDMMQAAPAGDDSNPLAKASQEMQKMFSDIKQEIGNLIMDLIQALSNPKGQAQPVNVPANTPSPSGAQAGSNLNTESIDG